jgi:hypothetical protein
MAMPETAMYENHNLPFWQHQVRAAGQILSMKPEPKSQTMHKAANDQLRACVRAADRPHDLGTPLWGKNVHIY